MNFTVHSSRDRQFIVWAALVLGIILTPPAWPEDSQERDNVRIITTPSTTAEVSVDIGKKIARQAYRQCGLEVSFLDAPAARAVLMAEQGQSDGELARIPMAVNPDAPLIPLNLPLDEARLVPLYLKNGTIKTVEGLADKRIGFLNGYRMIAKVLPETATQVAANNTLQLVNLLKRGRIDIALTLEWDALAAQNRNPTLAIGEPLLVSPIYHWVHVSRQEDIPCLSSAVEAMKKSSELDRIVNTEIRKTLP